MLTARGEFPEAAQEAPAVQGSFDFGTSSLREAVPSLRMTELVADSFSSTARGCASPGGEIVSGGGSGPVKPKDGLSGPPVQTLSRGKICDWTMCMQAKGI